MKRSKLLPGLVMGTLLLFFSCSKDEDPITRQSGEASLFFNALFNNLISSQNAKQAVEYPECATAKPAFVDVILSREGVEVVGTSEEPLRIPLNPNPTDLDNDGIVDYFTKEHSALQLTPGTYQLEYFTVLEENGSVIWIAPIDDGTSGGIDELVDDPLPMALKLGAGVKKYVDVGVVCFDDRIVNEYGYLFYDLNKVEVLEFCIFGNYCDETGRHEDFVLYEVDVWKFSGNPLTPKGKLLHENLQNSVDIADYEDSSDAFSHPICFTLPDGPGLDEYYVQISLTDMGAENVVIRSGLISDADVRNQVQEDGSIEYYHFREGNCNMEDSPDLLDVVSGGSPVCTTINFEDLASPEAFNSDYYAELGVQILVGTEYPNNAVKIMEGTCSKNVLHSLNYPFASVLFNFVDPVNSVSLVSGDYGEDEDSISVTAFSGTNGTGEIISSQTLVLAENEGGCLEFNLEGEGIRSVIVFGKSSIEGHNNTIFTDNLTFCK